MHSIIVAFCASMLPSQIPARKRCRIRPLVIVCASCLPTSLKAAPSVAAGSKFSSVITSGIGMLLVIENLSLLSN